MDKALATKLLAFQKEVQAIKKDMENPYFKSQYFDVNAVIEVIKPIFNKVGLVALQPLTVIGERQAIKTILIDPDTGSEYSEVSPIVTMQTKKTDDHYDNILLNSQEMGSSITYFRRYALVSMLLLQGEQDDDGNIASSPVVKKAEYKSVPKQVKSDNPF